MNNDELTNITKDFILENLPNHLYNEINSTYHINDPFKTSVEIINFTNKLVKLIDKHNLTEG